LTSEQKFHTAHRQLWPVCSTAQHLCSQKQCDFCPMFLEWGMAPWLCSTVTTCLITEPRF